jgi:hypothetical protein
VDGEFFSVLHIDGALWGRIAIHHPQCMLNGMFEIHLVVFVLIGVTTIDWNAN